jgi:hypothetical protein
MSRLKVIYATILAAIYVAASLLSPLSVLACDHPHHTHHANHSAAVEVHVGCHCHSHVAVAECGTETLNGVCCDHSHELLSDNYTQFIDSTERGSSVTISLYLLSISVAILGDMLEHNPMLLATEARYGGDEALPLRAASSRYDALRAPPTFA